MDLRVKKGDTLVSFPLGGKFNGGDETANFLKKYVEIFLLGPSNEHVVYVSHPQWYGGGH